MALIYQHFTATANVGFAHALVKTNFQLSGVTSLQTSYQIRLSFFFLFSKSYNEAN